MSTLTSRPVLNKLECPNCGSPVEQYNPSAQTIVCKSCDSYIGVGSGDPTLNGKSRKLPAPPVPIKLGDTATLAGTQFFVMGRVVYIGWDPMDTSDRWQWNEWLLGGADGRLLWMSYDEKGFSLYTRLRFRKPFNPRVDRELPVAEGVTAKIRESYPARIVGAEGELTWKAKENDELYMAEGAGGGKRYSIQQTSEEMEVHEGIAYSDYDVATAFGNETWANHASKRVGVGRSAGGESDGGVPMSAIVGLLCIVFAVIAFVAGSAVTSTGEQFHQSAITLTSTSNTTDMSFDVTNAQRPISVEIGMQTAMAGNNFFNLSAMIIDPEGQQRALFTSREFRQTSTSSSVTGFSTTTNAQFVPFKTGVHTIRLTVDNAQAINDGLILTATMRKDIITSNWFNMYAVIIGLVGAFLMARAVLSNVS